MLCCIQRERHPQLFWHDCRRRQASRLVSLRYVRLFFLTCVSVYAPLRAGRIACTLGLLLMENRCYAKAAMHPKTASVRAAELPVTVVQCLQKCGGAVRRSSVRALEGRPHRHGCDLAKRSAKLGYWSWCAETATFVQQRGGKAI